MMNDSLHNYYDSNKFMKLSYNLLDYVEQRQLLRLSVF